MEVSYSQGKEALIKLMQRYIETRKKREGEKLWHALRPAHYFGQ